MKNFLFMLSLLLLAACADDRQYVISGSGKGFTDGYKAYLVQQQNDAVSLLASAVVKNSSFEIKGIAEKPCDAIIAVCDSTHIDEQTMELLSEEGRPFSLDIFVEPGHISVTPYDWENNISAKASGTPLNDLYNKFGADVDSVKRNIGDDPDTMFSFIVPFILENVGNPVGVTVFDCWHWSMPKEMKLQILDSLETRYGDKYAELSAETCAELQHQQMRDKQRDLVQPGCKYKDVEETAADGKTVSLKSIVEKPKNRYVLLEFWATWCVPCMGELPYMRDAYNKYNGMGFEIYSVSIDDDAAAWSSVVSEKGLRWVNVRAAKESDVRDKYGLYGVPANFLIDCATGEIVATGLRGEALSEKLAELLDGK